MYIWIWMSVYMLFLCQKIKMCAIGITGEYFSRSVLTVEETYEVILPPTV